MIVPTRIAKALIATSFILANPGLADVTWKAVPAESKVEWLGAKVIGDKHHGLVEVKEAEVVTAKGLPQTATVVMDMTTLTNEDLTSKEWNAKLVEHLKSDDFFAVQDHPTATLKVASFEAKGKKKFEGKGSITIKGKTKPVTFTGTMEETSPKKRTASVDLKLDRTDFDVRFGSGKFFEDLGDKMIEDEISLKTTLVLVPAGQQADKKVEKKT